MKMQDRALLLGLAAGACFWLLDSLFCTFTFHGTSFLDTLITNVTPQHLFVRLLAFLLSVSFAIIGGRHAVQRHRATKALHESENRHKAFFEASPDGIVIADVQTRNFTYANPAICRMLGYTDVELTTMTLDDVHPKDALERVMSEFEAQAKGRKTLAHNIPCLTKDGTVVYADINTVNILLDGRECNLGFFRNITERKKVEEALRRQRDFAEGLIQTAQAVILLLDTRGRIVRFNPHLEKISGYSLEEVKGKDWFATLLPQRDRQRIRELFLTAVGDTQTHGNINPILTRDGREIYIEWCDKTLKDADGNVTGLLSIGQDVTERKRAEKDLRDSEKKFAKAFRASPNIMAITTLENGEFIDVNQACCSFSGYSRDELLGHNAENLNIWPAPIRGIPCWTFWKSTDASVTWSWPTGPSPVR